MRSRLHPRLPRFRRVSAGPAFAALLATALIFAPAGCGGGGGGSNSNSSYPAACGKSAYLPNYANGDGSGMTLAKWKSFPVRVYFDKDNGLYTADVQARAQTAFNGWVTQTGNKVQYTVVDSGANADIIVRFVSTSDTTLTSASAVGLTFVTDQSSKDGLPYDRSYLASAEVYIGLDGDTFRENGTMAHEFGHALGIGGHSPTVTDLMYRSGSSIRSQIPTTDDVNTLRTAYCDNFVEASADSRAVVPPSDRHNRRAIP